VGQSLTRSHTATAAQSALPVAAYQTNSPAQLAAQVFEELPLLFGFNALCCGGDAQLLGQHHHGLGNGAISIFGADAADKSSVNL
jgi:hypothetical protein